MSRVVPERLATIACCFSARVLKRLDLPTFGRPMRAILRLLSSVLTGLSLKPSLASSSVIRLRRSLSPWLVVADTRSGYLMPRLKNSSFGKDSPRSDLLSRSKVGLPDLSAFLAMSLSS